MEEQLRKAFEDVTTGNVNTIREYAKETRTLVRELEKELKGVQNLFLSREEEIRQLKAQVAMLLQDRVAGGS